jgi:hypothetical protein
MAKRRRLSGSLGAEIKAYGTALHVNDGMVSFLVGVAVRPKTYLEAVSKLDTRF